RAASRRRKDPGSSRTSSGSSPPELRGRASGPVREGGGASGDATRVLVDGDEGARGDALELIHEPEGPPGIDGPLEVPIAPVVGDDEPVVVHRLQGDARR